MPLSINNNLKTEVNSYIFSFTRKKHLIINTSLVAFESGNCIILKRKEPKNEQIESTKHWHCVASRTGRDYIGTTNSRG